MSLDVSYGAQDSLTSAKLHFRELYRRFANENETTTQQKKLFSKTKKVNLRPSMIDRACLKSKVVSSTPMVCNRRKAFTPDNTISVSTIDNNSQRKETPIEIIQADDLDDPEVIENPIPDNCSVVTLSSLADEIENYPTPTSDRPPSSMSVVSKRSNIESIISTLTNKSTKFSIKTSNCAIKKVARAPHKYNAERETQTGASLANATGMFSLRSSESPDEASDDSDTDIMIMNWEKGKDLPKSTFCRVKASCSQGHYNYRHPAYIERKPTVASTSSAKEGLPWRAASHLVTHVAHTPENAVNLENWDEAEDSLDETFLPKPPNPKKVFANKKKLTKKERRSNGAKKDVSGKFVQKNCSLTRPALQDCGGKVNIDFNDVSKSVQLKHKASGRQSRNTPDLNLGQRPENQDGKGESFAKSFKKKARKSKSQLLSDSRERVKKSNVNAVTAVENDLNNSSHVNFSIRKRRTNALTEKDHSKGHGDVENNIHQQMNITMDQSPRASIVGKTPNSTDGRKKTNSSDSRKKKVAHHAEDIILSADRRRRDTELELVDDDTCQDVSFDFNSKTNETNEHDSLALQMNRRYLRGIPTDLLEEFGDLASDWQNFQQNRNESKSKTKRQLNKDSVSGRKTDSKKKKKETVTPAPAGRSSKHKTVETVEAPLEELQPGTSRSPAKTMMPKHNNSKKKRNANVVIKSETDPGPSRSPAKTMMQKHNNSKKKRNTDVIQSETANPVDHEGLRRSGRERKQAPRRGVGIFFTQRTKALLASSSAQSFVYLDTSRQLITCTKNKRGNKSRKLTRSKLPSTRISLSPVKEVNSDFMDELEPLEFAEAPVEETQSTSQTTSDTNKSAINKSKAKKKSVISGGVTKAKSSVKAKKSVKDSLRQTMKCNSDEINNTLDVKKGNLLQTIKWAYKEPKFRTVKGIPGVSCTMTDGASGGIGMLKLGPGKTKPKQTAINYSIQFVITEGRAQIEVQDKNAVFNAFDMFLVPKGGEYAIKNLNRDKPLLLVFARSENRDCER